ncbi:MAG: LEA type 2 family protein [Alistipes sp.]|nr:LEA type 2 family protein [Alistipes sp.]
MRRLLKYVITLALLLFSANRAHAGILDKFYFEGFVAVTHLTTSGVNIWVDVRSEWAHTLIIKKGKVDVMMQGNKVGTIELRDKIVVPKRSKSRILVPLRFSADNALSFQRIVRNLVEKGGLGTTIDYRVRAGLKVLKLNFSDKNVAVSEILNNFALSNDSLNELIELI